MEELERELAAMTRERDEAMEWNHSVRVCKGHAPEIVGVGCVICEVERLREITWGLESDKNNLKALLREGLHPFDNQDAWLDYNKRIRAALGEEER